MARYTNTALLKKLGSRIREARLRQKLEIKDLVYLTGFSEVTINKIESGHETMVSYLVEVCKAVQLHPKDLFDMDITLKSRFELSPTRKEKTRLTSRITHYIEDGFFQEEKSCREVLSQIHEDYQIKSSTSSISVILNRLADRGILKSINRTGKKFYKS